MSVSQAEKELLELLKKDPKTIEKSQFESLLKQASAIPEKHHEAWKNFIETVLESNLDIIDELDISKVLSAIEDCAKKGKTEQLELILGHVLLNRFDDFNANREYQEQFKELIKELSQKSDKRALLSILDNKIKNLNKFDIFLEYEILDDKLVKTLLEDKTLTLSPNLKGSLSKIASKYENETKIKERKKESQMTS
jgi:hypothetical protein